MTTLLHISDLHFGCEQPAVVAALEALAHAKKPDVLIVSGDITQRATKAQFAEARAFCDRLRVPALLALPGNHDVPLFNVFDRVFRPYAAYEKAFGPVLEQHYLTPLLCISMVNTTRAWRHKNGEVSTRQIDQVCRQLSRATERQLRVVVVHQPVHVLRPKDEHDRLINWQSAIKAWSAAGADMVLGGHIHLPYVCELSAQVDGMARRMWCVQAGTAVSSRIRREVPNSVNLIEFSTAAQGTHKLSDCAVQRWDYQQPNSLLASKGDGQQAAGQFALTHTSVLDLQRG